MNPQHQEAQDAAQTMTDAIKLPELLPCPFCGCAAGYVKHSAGVQGTQGFDRWDAVACKHCRATVGACDRRFRCREDARDAWNRRMPAIRAIAAPGVAQGWKPLETAPEDGTPIIIARIEDGCVYDVCNGHIENVLEDEEDGPWDIRGGEPWCSSVGRPRGTYFCSWLPDREWEDRWRISPSFEYTHWMPTPAAAPSPTAEQHDHFDEVVKMVPPASSPVDAARSVAKWLNERPNRPINLEDVAMLVHYVQSASIKGGTAE